MLFFEIILTLLAIKDGWSSLMNKGHKGTPLSRHYLFGALRPGEFEQVLALSKEKTFSRSAIIFQKGDPGSSMMAILRGRVRICSSGWEGKELLFNILEPGDVFGELALLDGRTRSADAVAMEDCAMLVVERRDFLPFLDQNPRVSIRLIEVLCGHVRRISDTIEGLAFLELPARLARLLLRLSQSHGRPVRDGVQIELKLSQSDLGALVAASRESVNRLLRLWQDQGLLTMKNRLITIGDSKALEEYATESLPP